MTNNIYVANYGGNSVTVIDGRTNVATVAAGENPIAVAVNPVTNKIYVANELSYDVTVINGTTNEKMLDFSDSGTINSGQRIDCRFIHASTGESGAGEIILALNRKTDSSRRHQVSE